MGNLLSSKSADSDDFLGARVDATTSLVSDCSSTNDHANYRLLALDGETGTVFCRIHNDKQKSRIPTLSDAGVIECATRTLLRMRNVTAVRQKCRAESMIGPGDAFCTCEVPHKQCFTIELPTSDLPAYKRFPKWIKHPLEAQVPRGSPYHEPNQQKMFGLRPVETGKDSVVVKATWISGKGHPEEIEKRKKLYREQYNIPNMFGASLFEDPGLMEISLFGDENEERIEFPCVDATSLDLFPFRCRLVRNDEPFLLGHDREGVDADPKPKDNPAPVSYTFGANYTHRCVAGDDAGGLFLEVHWGFRQTMTPLTPEWDAGPNQTDFSPSCGFIVVARFLDGRANTQEDFQQVTQKSVFTETPRDLELVALRIPLGWTIIIDHGCIHGDSTFTGCYMMGMSTNHIVMSSADTVFIKNAKTKRNMNFVCDAHRKPIDVASVHGGMPANCLPPKTSEKDVDEDVKATEVPRVCATPEPIVVFSDNATVNELTKFYTATKGINFIIQPFSKLSWYTTFYRRFGWYPGMRNCGLTTSAQNISPLSTEVNPKLSEGRQ